MPGTRESWEAALVASIPRTAEIVRGTETALGIDVTYAGEPVFAPIETIETTNIELAINTSYQVLRYRGTYYLCHNAVWLTSTEPTGPVAIRRRHPVRIRKDPAVLAGVQHDLRQGPAQR